MGIILKSKYLNEKTNPSLNCAFINADCIDLVQRRDINFRTNIRTNLRIDDSVSYSADERDRD